MMAAVGVTFKQFIGNSTSGVVGVLNTIVVPLIFAFAFLVFIYGVIRYFFLRPTSTTSYGGRDGYSEGRQYIFWGILGMVVMFSVWGLVNLLLSTLGISPS